MDRRVAVNEAGAIVGQDHPRAKLTDREVELMRQLHQEGVSLANLAEKFEVSAYTVKSICYYRRRAQIAFAWKVIKRKL